MCSDVILAVTQKDFTNDSSEIWNHIHDLWGTVQRVVDREKQNYIPTLKRLCNDVSSLKRAARKRAGTQDRGSTDHKRQKRQTSIDEFYKSQ